MVAHERGCWLLIGFMPLLGCSAERSRNDTPEKPSEWVAVQSSRPPSSNGSVRIDGLSLAQPIPGQPLRLHGAGFGDDRTRVLVGISSGHGRQTRSQWVRPTEVASSELTVLVPLDASGDGRLEVYSPSGRSGGLDIRYQEPARPRIVGAMMLPFETVLSVEGPGTDVDHVDVLVDGGAAGTATRSQPGVFHGLGLFQLSGTHDIQVARGGLVSAPWRVSGPASPVVLAQ